MKKIVSMLIAIYLLIPPLPVEASGGLGKENAKHGFDSKENSYEAWSRIKIDSQPSPDATPEDLHKILGPLNRSTLMNSYETYEAIITNSKKNGINPYIMLLMSIHESGWMNSKLAKSHTNPFGMKCSSRDISSCVNGYSKFKTIDDAYFDQSWLLRNHYVEKGKVTIKDVLLTYAPPSDGNTLFGSGGYIDSMRKNGYNYLGLTAEGNFNLGEMSPDAEYEGGGSGPRSSSTGDGSDLFLNFEDPYVKRGVANVGEDVTDAPYLRYMLNNITDKVYNRMMVASYIGVAFIVAYISFTVLVYVLYIKGNINHTKAEKLIGKGLADTYGGTKGLIAVTGRIGLGVLLIVFFLSGLYINVMAFIYTMLSRVMDFIV